MGRILLPHSSRQQKLESQTPKRHELKMQCGGHIYIITNKRYGVLYIGVTADLPTRIARHREATGGVFTAKYRCTRLVYVEEFSTIEEAIAREKAMKAWKRKWKIEAIEAQNPTWDDLYLTLLS